MKPAHRPRIFSRGSYGESVRISTILRSETVGGALLLAATVIALIWANSPLADGYFNLRDFRIGPESLHLNLSLGTWASDGLLAIFFFVAGLELKREFVAGDLRNPARAVVPIAAAVGGVIVPALFFVVVNFSAGPEVLKGWAIPTATDIAFALAVLAVISTHLPSALRTFLLTLAVVDDLIAIAIIAVFYPGEMHFGFLALAVLPLLAFTWLVQKRIRSWYLLIPLAAATWALVHASGVHATVAGVLLGFAVPVIRSAKMAARTPAPAWPNTLNIACAPFPPAWPCRCSPSSPPASHSVASPGSRAPSPTPWPLASCLPWWQESSSASLAPPGW